MHSILASRSVIFHLFLCKLKENSFNYLVVCERKMQGRLAQQTEFWCPTHES